MTNLFHTPVLLSETLGFLDPKKGEIFVDCTLGGSGHAKAILEKISPDGKLIGIDQDPKALEESRNQLKDFKDKATFVQDNFFNLKNILQTLASPAVDGILLDLGVSSYQLDTPERGFSFTEKAEEMPLDMRMNPQQQIKAYDIVNFYPEKRLREIFFKLGEEPFGGKIAGRIVEARSEKPLGTVGDLLEVIKKALPPNYRFSQKPGQWASKIFRALRMEVNQELNVLEGVLPQALDSLKPGGRLGIISFHSLEDRIVKHQFQQWENNGLVEILTKKPITASSEELALNTRANSAKLRAVKKL